MKSTRRQNSRALFKNWSKFEAALAGVTALLLLFGYSTSFSVPFQFDDMVSIPMNPSISKWLDPVALWNFQGPRLVTIWTFAVNYALGGLDPWGYHLFNLIVHAMACAGVYTLCTTLLRKSEVPESGSRFASAMVTVLFATHPIQTQAVTYIVQRAAVLAAMFYVWALVFYFHSLEQGSDKRASRNYFVASALCMVLGMFSKEPAGTAPVACFLLEQIWFSDKTAGRKNRRLFLGSLLLIVPVVTLAFGRYSSDVQEFAYRTPSPIEYFGIQVGVIAGYLKLLIWPFAQVLECEVHHPDSFLDSHVIAPLFLHVAILFAAFKVRTKLPGFWFGALLFYLGHSIESSVFPLPDPRYEHRMYLPMVGLAVAGASILSVLSSINVMQPLPSAIALAAIGFLPAILTMQRNIVWQSDLALWGDSVEKCPATLRAQLNLGKAYLLRADYQRAFPHLEAAAALDSNSYDAQFSLGMCHQRLGQPKEAMVQLRKALAISQTKPDAYYGLGVLSQERGDRRGAIEHFQASVRHGAKFRSLSLSQIAELESNLGNLDATEAAYRGWIAESPADAAAHLGLAQCLARQKKFSEAGPEFQEAHRLAPRSFEAAAGLALMADLLGKFDLAAELYSKAIQIDPLRTEARFNRVMVLLRLEKVDEAAREYANIRGRAPVDWNGFHLMSKGFLQVGRRELAMSSAEAALALSAHDPEGRNREAEIRAVMKAAQMGEHRGTASSP